MTENPYLQDIDIHETALFEEINKTKSTKVAVVEGKIY